MRDVEAMGDAEAVRDAEMTGSVQETGEVGEMEAGEMEGGEMPVRGTCFGYEIRSRLDLDYLRGGTGDPLEIADASTEPEDPGELLREWPPPYFPTHVELYADGEGYRVWIDGGGWYLVDPDAPRVTVPREGSPLRREERIWGLPILLCFLARGDLPLHAAAVEVDGRALLLAAPSRFGKTTLAAGFALAGHRVLSEDLTCLRLGSAPAVIPGPAMLRVRRDVADAFDLDGTLELGRDDDRVHLSIETDRGTCDPVPLGGLALLNEDDTDPLLEPVSGAEAVRNLWAVSFNFSRTDDRIRSFRSVAKLASQTRTWSLTRRMELEDLRPTVERLVEAFRSGS